MLESITSWDFSVLNYILTNLKCKFCDFLFPILDKIGYAGAMFIVLGIILLFFRITSGNLRQFNCRDESEKNAFT